MGHLAFAAAIEALISSALSRRSSNELPNDTDVMNEAARPVRSWQRWIGAVQLLRRPDFLRPCDGKS